MRHAVGSVVSRACAGSAIQSVQIVMLLYFVQLCITTQIVYVCAGDIFVAQPWAPARQIPAGRLAQALHGVAKALSVV